MTENKNASLFLIMNIILLIIFICMTIIFFEFHKYMLIGHLVLLAGLLFFSAIGLLALYSGANFGSALLSLIFAVVLIDMIVIRTHTAEKTILLLTGFVSLVGFFISIAAIKRKETEQIDEPIEQKPKTEYKPGKFVGSKTGSSYHVPKCEWAKKIKENKRVWFDSESEAKKEGYEAHSCVE